MSGLPWKDGDLALRLADYAAAAGIEATERPEPLDRAPALPRAPSVDWVSLRPVVFSRQMGGNSDTNRASERTPLTMHLEARFGKRVEAREALTLLAHGATGLIDWRRKREALTRA